MNKSAVTQLRSLSSIQEKEDFCYKVPLLRGLKPVPENGKCVIYGAGNFGKQLYARLKARVVCFADQNPQFAGKQVEGCPVYTVTQAKEMFPDAWFIVAGASGIAGSMMSVLQKHGILEYSYFSAEIDE